MIRNAREAKALGLAWLDLKFRLPDGSKVEINGPFSKDAAVAIFNAADTEDPECTRIIKASGSYEVPS